MVNRSIQDLIVAIFTGLATLYLGIFFVLYVFITPYTHLTWSRTSGNILWVDPNRPASAYEIEVNDKILSLGNYPFHNNYNLPFTITLINIVLPNNKLPMRVMHNSQIIDILWPISTPDFTVILRRIILFFPVIEYQIATLLTFLFLRPKDERRRAITVFFQLTAISVACVKINGFNLLGSDYIGVLGPWLWGASALYLFSTYPKPIAPIGPLVPIFLFGICGLVGLAEIFHILPKDLFMPTASVILAGCMVLLLLHLFQPDQQRMVGLFLIGILMIIAVLTIIAIFATRFNSRDGMTWAIYLILPYLPLIILFPITRKRMPGIELRANQVFINGLFVLMLVVASVILWQIYKIFDPSEDTRIFLVFVLFFISTEASLLAYPAFKQWVQKKLLGIPFSSNQLLQRFSGRIATSPEASILARALQDEVMPALMIKQMALLRIYEDGKISTLVSSGLTSEQIPTARQIPELVNRSGKYTPPISYDDSQGMQWPRLILKLEAVDQLVGICLLGQRDPDDFYSADEIPMLQSLMDQTALALFNIEQAERIHAYHQSNIQRNEEEQNRLSRDLHDDVLGQLALIQMNLPKGENTAEFQIAFNTAVSRVRRIMNGLKPAVLEFGLYNAIHGLAEELTEQIQTVEIIEQILAQENPRYPREVETHVFRIVQEACQNAIRHGQAQKITIYGTLQPDLIELIITDNGKGFSADEKLELSNLLKQGHFGLVNIFERALMIGAKVDIQSASNQGASIVLQWKKQS